MRNTVSKIKTLVVFAFLITSFSQLIVAAGKEIEKVDRSEINKLRWTNITECQSYGGDFDWPKIDYTNVRKGEYESEAEYGQAYDEFYKKIGTYFDKNTLSNKKMKEFKKCIDRANPKNLSAIDNLEDKDKASCKEEKVEMNKSVTEMLKDCGKANMGTDYSSCLKQASSCRKCNPLKRSDDDESLSDDCDEDDVGEIEAYGSGIQKILMNGNATPATPDLQKSFRKFSQCPAMAAENYDKMKDEVKEGEEKTRELTSKLTELQESANKVAEDAQKEENEFQDQMDELEREIDQKVKEIGEKESKIKSETDDLAYQIADKINEAEEAIRNLDIKKQDANIAYNVKVAEASSKCYEASLNKLKDLNKRKQDLIQASQYSAGGFNNLMNSTGLSSRKKMQNIMDKYYRECKSALPYTDNMKLLKKTLNSEFAKIEDEKRKIKTRIAQLNRNLEIAKKRLPGELTKLFEDLASFKKQAEKKLDRIQQRLAQSKYKYANIQNILNQKISQTQTQLRQEQSYLQQKQTFLALQHQFSGGFSSDKNSANEALSSMDDVASKLGSVISSCKCASESPVDLSACELACKYDTSYNGVNDLDCTEFEKVKKSIRSNRSAN